VPETVAVVDYGAGNLRSAAKALEAAGAAHVVVTGDPDAIAAFAHCINALRGRSGLEEALREAVIERGRPFLGICVGMQLLADEGHEHGVHAGLGWIPGTVERLTPADAHAKIPHMGWNRVEPAPGSDVTGGDAYFVHSYRFSASNDGDILASTDYAGRFPAVIGRGNLLGTQFHPEKSQAYGLAFLAKFIAWRP
jgi:glutamine amidotransferase